MTYNATMTYNDLQYTMTYNATINQNVHTTLLSIYYNALGLKLQ